MLISHWCKLIEGLQTSPLDFYKSIVEAIDRRKVPGLARSPVLWPEGGLLSAKRHYLRLSREKLVFDICAAPFGTGFFVSCRLVDKEFPWHLLVAFLVALGVLSILAIVVFVDVTFGHALAVIAAISWSTQFAVFCALIWIAWILLRNVLRNLDTLLIRNIYLGPWYERITRRNTFYRIDLMLMFQAAVQAAVLEVVDKHLETNNLKPLTELERKPTLSALLMR